jgi:hypothetical protein
MLAVKLRQRRRDAGALTLASTEVRFKLDAETQDPTDVAAYNLKESNALVEEWMLIANITVAKKVLRHYPTLAILRRHQPPSRTQFESLLEAARAVGVSLNIDSSKTLADSLDRAVRPGDVNFNKLLRILSTRCMMPAQYFCSGELPKDQWHHYGLATPVYTHFTSPIRRYADLLVHRLLAAAISVTSLPVANADRARQHDICSHMNRRHRAAQHIQRASVGLHSVLFFTDYPTVEPAYVLTVMKDRISIISPKYGIESLISMASVVDYLKHSSSLSSLPLPLPLQRKQAGQTEEEDWVRYDGKACSLTLMHKPSVKDTAQKQNKSKNSSSSSSSSTKKGKDEDLVPYHEFKVFDQISVYISVSRACPEEGRPSSTLQVNLVLEDKVFYEDSYSALSDVISAHKEQKSRSDEEKERKKSTQIAAEAAAAKVSAAVVGPAIAMDMEVEAGSNSGSNSGSGNGSGSEENSGSDSDSSASIVKAPPSSAGKSRILKAAPPKRKLEQVVSPAGKKTKKLK